MAELFYGDQYYPFKPPNPEPSHVPTLYPHGASNTPTHSDLERVARQTVAVLRGEGFKPPFTVREHSEGAYVSDANRQPIFDCFELNSEPQAHAICALLNALPWHEAP